MIKIIIAILAVYILFVLFGSRDTNEGFRNIKLNFIQEMELKKMLKTINEVFSDNNIDYAITGQTLASSLEHKDLIPGDSHAQIIVVDPKKVQSIDWKKYGCNLHKTSSGFQLCFSSNPSCDPPYIDITVSSKEDEQNELYPIKKYQFGDLLLNGPNKPNNYLK